MMKRHLRIGLATLLLSGVWTAAADDFAQRQVGEMVLQGVPEIEPSLRERMLQYLNVRSASLQSLTADGGTMLITTRFGDTAQLHRVRMPLGERYQLTFFDEPIAGGGYVRGTSDQKVLYVKSRGGDERNQYFLLDLPTGKHQRITDGKARHVGGSMPRDGRWMVYAGTARNDKDFDLYVMDMQAVYKAGIDASPEALAATQRLLWQVEGQYYPGEVRPDDKLLLVQRFISERETQWFTLDPVSGAHQPLTPQDAPFFYGGGAWSKTGDAIYFFTDRESDFRKLYRYEVASGKWNCLTNDLNWDIEDVSVDPASGGIAFVANEDGASKLYFANADGSNRRAVSGLPAAAVLSGVSFCFNGGVGGLNVNSAAAPNDAYTVTYPEGKVTRWTESEVGGLNPATFIAPELIRYPTFDQVDGKPRMIPAYYYKGRGAGPRPVIIMNHGGPEGQFLPTFSSTIQFWTNELGISVLQPNVRGSTGYGRAFHQLDNGIKREDSVRDNGALLDWIAKQPELDAQRVGVFGGSYGGYMVLASLTNYPGRIKAGIDIVGIASFITFLQNTPEFRRDLRRAEYGDEREPETRKVLEAISPLANAGKIQAALFVLHGKNDNRVPYTEAEQIVTKMRELQRPVWYALALNEGHGFQKKPNSDLAAMMYALFWKEHLLK